MGRITSLKGYVVVMKDRITSILCAAMAFFLLIAISTFWQPCRGYVEMPCQRSASVARTGLAVIAALNIAALFIKRKFISPVAQLFTVVGGIGLLLVPKLGSCLPIPGMSCVTHTWPALRVGGLLLISLSLVSLVWTLIANGRRQDVHNR